MNINILNIILLLLLGSRLFGQTDSEALKKINQQVDSSSSIEHTLIYLSDVYGPRLMGTPNYYNSVKWIERELQDWGLESIYLENFDDDYIGWAVKDFEFAQIEPNYFYINAYPLAFSQSTKGTTVGEPLFINSFEEIYNYKGKLNGKIVFLNGYYRPVSNFFEPMSVRFDDNILNRAAANPDPNDVIVGYHSRRSTVDVFGFRARVKIERQEFFEFCKREEVVAIVEPSNFPYGILHADGNRTVPSLNREEDIRPIASFVMSNEHFGRIARLVSIGIKPRLRVGLTTELFREPEYNVNLIAEIPGSDPDLKDELVIIGAHLDSWHAGTGAVDNASNCSVLLEAMRALQLTDLKPKRTIRMILWGGEEQVFAGSKHYVSDRIGDFESGAIEIENKRVSAYLNLDNGAGMIRGIFLSGNEAAKPYFAHYFAPFDKSQTLTIQNANQTDHELFDYFNIPAFQFIQDPMDYMTAIHHTNMDLYEYVPIEDQNYNAKLLAYTAYKIAQEDDLIPRRRHHSTVANKEGNTTFQLSGYQDANQVYIVGNFNSWNMFGTPMYRTESGWECKLDLSAGKYFYKFIVDGQWTADPATPSKELTTDGRGHGGLTIKLVK